MGKAVSEADTESLTQVPYVSSKERFFVYTVDEMMSKLGRTPGGEYSQKLRIQHNRAIRNREKNPALPCNSSAEETWNRVLLDNFGLSGYLYFYSPFSQGSFSSKQVTEKVPTIDQAMIKLEAHFKYQDRLKEACHFYAAMHPSSAEFEVWKIARHVIDSLWKDKVGSIFAVASKINIHMEAVSAEELRRYLEIYHSEMSLTGLFVLDNFRELRKAYSLKRGFPLSADDFYFIKYANRYVRSNSYWAFYEDDFIDPVAVGRAFYMYQKDSPMQKHDIAYPQEVAKAHNISKIEIPSAEMKVYVEAFRKSLDTVAGESHAAVYKNLIATATIYVSNFQRYDIELQKMKFQSDTVERLIILAQPEQKPEKAHALFKQQIAQLIINKHHELLAEGVESVEDLYAQMQEFIGNICQAIAQFDPGAQNVLYYTKGSVSLEKPAPSLYKSLLAKILGR